MTESFPLTARRAEAYQSACVDRGAIAFVGLTPPEGNRLEGVQGSLGVAVANERGYFPVPLGWARYATLRAAQEHADALNRDVLHLSNLQAVEIIASTMGGRRYYPPAGEDTAAPQVLPLTGAGGELLGLVPTGEG